MRPEAPRHRRRRGGAPFARYAKHADDLFFVRDHDNPGAGRGQLLQALAGCGLAGAGEAGGTKQVGLSVEHGAYTHARHCTEFVDRPRSDARLASARQYRLGERMLGMLLQRRGDLQDGRFVMSDTGQDRGDGRFAERQRTGLVDKQRADLAGVLKRAGTAY